MFPRRNRVEGASALEMLVAARNRGAGPVARRNRPQRALRAISRAYNGPLVARKTGDAMTDAQQEQQPEPKPDVWTTQLFEQTVADSPFRAFGYLIQDGSGERQESGVLAVWPLRRESDDLTVLLTARLSVTWRVSETGEWRRNEFRGEPTPEDLKEFVRKLLDCRTLYLRTLKVEGLPERIPTEATR